MTTVTEQRTTSLTDGCLNDNFSLA